MLGGAIEAGVYHFRGQNVYNNGACREMRPPDADPSGVFEPRRPRELRGSRATQGSEQ